KLVEVERPSPGRSQVLVKVKSAGVALPDLMSVQGRYSVVPTPPVTPGQEVVGEVVEAGSGSAFPVGQRVLAWTMFRDGSGGFAEYALAHDRDIFPAPTALSDEEAAGFLVPYHTAHV